MRSTGPDLATRQCVVDGCDHSDLQGHGMCQMHYYRWRRQGDPGEGERRLRSERGVCAVDGCGQVDAGPHGLCGKHATRVRRHGDWSIKLPPGAAGSDHHKWLNDDELTYNAVHFRLRKFRGSARRFPCAACGNAAWQWAYDHSDPAELIYQGMPYSADPNHYQPMCVPCHKKMDLARKRVL